MASCMFDISDFEDSKVWDLICEGRTKGVFQLESSLGRHWAKKTKPRSVNELAALISLIRPGVLKAKVDGKSMADHYVDRKDNKDPVTYPHDSLEPILEETFGVLVYQEQSMKIAQVLAGFDLKEADALRKAIGKKKADLMEKVKTKFLQGAKKQDIITEDVADEIFSWIEKSNRYAFNKSHAVSYAINAYQSAYCKTYRLKKFYNVYLNRSDKKPKPDIEKKELIMDAKSEGVEVLPPRLQHLYTDFTMNSKKNIIYFGMNHIKNVGIKECDKIQDLKNSVDISTFNWLDCLINIIYKCNLNKRSVISLISVGAFNGINNVSSRAKMLYEFDSWKQLSAREQEFISNNYKDKESLAQCIEYALDSPDIKINSRRSPTVLDIKNSLQNPFYSLEDTAHSMSTDEEKYMSCSLTCNKIDGIDLNIVTSVCKDICKETITGKVNLAVQINSVRPYKTKRGKNPGQTMAFLCVEDGSGSLDSVTIFPESYEKHRDLLIEGNTVLLVGEISKKDKKSVIVNGVSQI